MVGDFDQLIAAAFAVENANARLRHAEVTGQRFDYGLIGFAFLWRRTDPNLEHTVRQFLDSRAAGVGGDVDAETHGGF